MCVFCCFVVNQVDVNNYNTTCHHAKYGKNLDIYKQMAKVFLLRCRSVDYKWLSPCASLSLRRLRDNKSKGDRRYRGV